MKKLCCALLLVAGAASAQTRPDSIRLARQIAQWYDLRFTDAEADSLLESLQEYGETYRSMHVPLPPNSLPYPFAFTPGAFGTTVPQGQKTINWVLPDQQLPANRVELAFYSIPQLASLLRSKKISSLELTQFFMARLRKWGDTLQSVITLTEERALEEARQADAEIRAGKWRGPLHGIPYGLKDLFAVKGYKTTWGSAPYKEQVLEEDAFAYTQLRKAGAVLCAKLSLGALAYNNKWFGGETKNPWDLTQGSSGSSAGSAASVVAGLLPFTVGTETLGSIVSPSARCGATGLRPTFGTISRSGAMALCWSLDKIGPICRSAEDDAIVYYYLKGTDGRDPGATDHAFNFDPKGDVKKLRVAYAANYFRRLPAGAPEWKVLDTYRALGVEPVAVQFPDSAAYRYDMVGLILAAESAAAFDGLTRSDRDSLVERQDKDFWPNIFRGARFIPAVEYINANRWRYELGRQVQSFMKDWDVVITPSFAGRQLSITNLTGHPALCMPIGFNKEGRPQSITLLGNLYDEAAILQAAKAYQERTGYHRQHPALFRQ
ncbi:amidase [Flaviaesturariibacter aridisoli]|uniref:Amidase n=1 Tax=Flaviaesturariibacter aridisoli TaxID=2545761 RepID=A0A4R4E545_9BACT|nr:amidase [Flaviaesturariibacter aridisoli]TCZ74117.1 amidase [Flaviaesturariibacter aridisoli]